MAGFFTDIRLPSRRSTTGRHGNTDFFHHCDYTQSAWPLPPGRQPSNPSRMLGWICGIRRSTDMWAYLSLGLGMGLNAGISPGPLLALVVAASLRSGLAGGLLVALAPLVTDVPIIALSTLLAGYLPPDALRWVGILGGLVVVWMGVGTIRSARNATLPSEGAVQAEPRRELWRGVTVNALNPHPYLFWTMVGGPALVSGWRESPLHALAFLVPFYALLIGSKAAIAWLVSRQAGGLSQVWYRRTLAGSGVLLLAMGVWLAWQAWSA